MNFKILRWVLIFIGMQILALSIIGGYSFFTAAEEENGLFAMNKMLITVKNPQNISSEAFFSLEDIDKLNDYSITLTATSLEKTENETINITGTNSTYINFCNIEFSSGCFFDRNAEIAGEQVIVIDEKLAWNKFGSINAVGNTMKLFNKNFRVIGIISENKSIVGLISNSGLPNAYIPIRALLEIDKTAKVNSLQIQTDDTTLSGKNTSEAIEMLNMMGKSLDDYYISDLNIKKVLIEQKPRIIVFIIGIVCIIAVFMTFINKTKEIFIFINNKAKTDYMINIIKIHKNMLILQLIKLLLFLSTIVLIWKFIKFDIYIPPEYLPKELIDFNFYVNLFWKSIERINLSKGYIPPMAEIQLNSITLLSNWLFCLGLFIGFPILLINLMRSRINRNYFYRVFMLICILFIISIALSSVVMLLSGITQKLNTADLAVLFSFNYIFLIKNSFKNGKEKVKNNEKNMPYYYDGSDCF